VVPFSYVSWYVAGLPGSPDFEVGETLACHFQLSLSAQAPLVWPFSFSVSTYVLDLNPSNDIGTVVLQKTAAASVPTPLPTLSPLSLTLLIGLLIGAGGWCLKRVM
jgi:hypothetical protein